MKTLTAIKALKETTKTSSNYFTDYIISKLDINQRSRIVKRFFKTKDSFELLIPDAIISRTNGKRFYELGERVGILQETENLLKLFDLLPNDAQNLIKKKLCKN